MMNRTKQSGVLAAVAAGALVLGACGSAAPAVGPVELSSAGPASAVPGGGPPEQDPAQRSAPEDAQQAPDAVEQPSGPVTLDGEYLVDMGEVGSARFEVAGSRLALVELSPAPGFRVTGQDLDSDEIEIDLRNGPIEVELEVEIDDGRFDTELEIDRPAVPGPYIYTVGDAGTVTVDTDGRAVTLVGQDTAAGWVATVDERGLARGEVEIVFRDDTGRVVAFDAEIDDGELEVDIDTVTPPRAR